MQFMVMGDDGLIFCGLSIHKLIMKHVHTWLRYQKQATKGLRPSIGGRKRHKYNMKKYV
jgi:hypothetical protein